MSSRKPIIVDAGRSSRRALWFGAFVFAVVGFGGIVGTAASSGVGAFLFVGLFFLLMAVFLAYGALRAYAGERLVFDTSGVHGSGSGHAWSVPWTELERARTATATIATNAGGRLRGSTMQVPCVELVPSDVNAAAARTEVAHLWVEEQECWQCPLSPAGRSLRKAARGIRRFRPRRSSSGGVPGEASRGDS